MADNDATVQSLTIDRLKLTKPDGDVKLEILYTINMLINEHDSEFQKDLTVVLPQNLQNHANHLWTDIREHLLSFLDLELE